VSLNEPVNVDMSAGRYMSMEVGGGSNGSIYSARLSTEECYISHIVFVKERCVVKDGEKSAGIW
jgi:hypothetical protein